MQRVLLDTQNTVTSAHRLPEVIKFKFKNALPYCAKAFVDSLTTTRLKPSLRSKFCSLLLFIVPSCENNDKKKVIFQ